MRRDFVRDFVTLQNVLERSDLDFELAGQPQKHEHLILAIRMAMDETFPVQDLQKRFELEIAARRQAILLF